MKALLLAAVLVQSAPALAQQMDHGAHDQHHDHAPPAPPPPPEPEPVETQGHDHHQHAQPPVDHSAHQMPAPTAGDAAAPALPGDHAADALFDPAEMARARANLRKEHGAVSSSMVLFDLAEVQVRNGREGYRWEGEAWFGGDIDRFQIKHEGEGHFGEPIEDIEVQALWSHAVSPWFNAQLGLRHDIVPNPSRTYAVLGVEGLAPYWFHLGGQVFLSDKGDLHARVEGSYDERITQRLILQPRFEVNLAAQDVPALDIGAGLSDFELGLRLRYEIRRELAPYIGIEWSGTTGETARLARQRGEDTSSVKALAGIRVWF